MRRLKNIYSLILGVSVLMLAGCLPQAGGGVTDESPSSNGSSTQSDGDGRGFDPMEFQVDRINIPQEKPQSGDLRGNVDIVAVDSLLADNNDNRVTNVPDEVDSLNSQAFRVQLFTSKVYGDSKKEMKIGEEIFDRPLFLDYEVPYFKVRVGNFPDRESAEDYLMKVKSAGYSSAWVVLVNIAIKETAPLYDDEYPELYLDSVLSDDKESESTDDGQSPKP